MSSFPDTSNIPPKTGVYLFRDKNGKVIYVGKANNLRSRVSQYANPLSDKRIQVYAIRNKTASIDYMLTGTEMQALLLEYTLIRKFQPAYNVRLKDNNKYPYIRISNDDFPSVTMSWNNEEPGTYYGPYTSVGLVNVLIEYFNDIFSLRRCKGKMPSKKCMELELGNCDGPCIGNVSKEEYHERIVKIRNILKGGYSGFIDLLKERMEEDASRQKFENAARIRDTVRFVYRQINRGKKTGFKGNKDVLAIARHNRSGVFTLMKMRKGIITDTINRRFTVSSKSSDNDVVKDIFLDYYSSTSDFDFASLIIPPDISLEEHMSLLPEGISAENADNSQSSMKLFNIAFDNAVSHLHTFLKKDFNPASVIELSSSLKLNFTPEYICGVDISHFSGKWTAGAVVCFKNGKPYKTMYRYYNLKDIENNDYLAIKTIIERYAGKHRIDLLIVDGGLGQLKAAIEGLKNAGTDIPAFCLAKRPDMLYNSTGTAVSLDRRSAALRLIKSIRDESHRFANKLRKIRMKDF